MTRTQTKILLFLLIFFVYSCSTTKKIEKGQYLLSANIIKEDGKTITNSSAYNSIFQKPNKKSLIFFPLGLWFYNGSNKLLQKPLEKWFSDPRRTKQSLDSLLIQDSLFDWTSANRNIFRHYQMARNRFFVGNEALPVLVDSIYTYKSERTLKNYYALKEGFLNAKVSAQTVLLPIIKNNFSKKKKQRIRKEQNKAVVIYHVTKGTPYVIDSLAYFIENKKIDSIYKTSLEKSYLHKEQNFNETAFLKEKTRIVKLLHNQGYYYFDRNNIRMEADSVTLGRKRLIGIIHIGPTSTDSLKLYSSVFKISKVNIINHDQNTKNYAFIENKPSLSYKGYNIINSEQQKYKPRVFTDEIVIATDSLYRRKNDLLTKENFNRLRNFQIPEIRYQRDTLSNNRLTANIFLTSQKKYGLDINNDTFSSTYLTVGVSPSVSLLSRNIFRGAENLKLSLKLIGGSVAKIDNASGFASEASIGAKLSFPRFIIPFINTENLLNKTANKSTNTELSATWQNNIGIGKVELSNGISYNWRTSHTTRHKIELSNIQYIKNFNKARYFSLYTRDKDVRDSQYENYFKFNPEAENQYKNNKLSDNNLFVMIRDDADFKKSDFFNSTIYEDYLEMIQRQKRITEDVLINSSSYTFEYDGRRSVNNKNPFYLKSKLELVGNTLKLLDNLLNFNHMKDALIYKNSFLDVGYAQYAKFDLDMRKYWRTGSKSQIASRFLFGCTIPYGNAKSSPFSKTYFAGGSNDIRAWRAYELGPGESNQNQQSFSTEHLKITTDIEWRRKLSNRIDGALFVDAGNIWAIDKNASKESLFKLDTFYKQIAIGSGFGLRYNFGYNIVFRLDMAYKIHDPGQIQGKRWFHNFKVWAPVFNIGIGYPF